MDTPLKANIQDAR